MAASCDHWAVRIPVLAAVAAGGAAGAAARYGAGGVVAEPAVATLVVNLSGCLLIGVLAVLADQVWAGHRLLRPFIGTGLLGGYTTFSGFAIDVHRLVAEGRHLIAAAYLAGTLAGALLAVQLGVVATRSAVGAVRRRRSW